MLFFHFDFGLSVAAEKDVDQQVNRKLKMAIAERVQKLCKMVALSMPSFTNVEEVHCKRWMQLTMLEEEQMNLCLI